MLMAVPSILVKVRIWVIILTHALQMCNSRIRIDKLTCFSVLQLHVFVHTEFSYVTLNSKNIFIFESGMSLSVSVQCFK